jgi:hypothetical protein
MTKDERGSRPGDAMQVSVRQTMWGVYLEHCHEAA